LIGFYLLDQNQQGTTETVSQLPTSIQRNNQLGFIQQQPSIFLLFFFRNNSLLFRRTTSTTIMAK
jgi:hypothetical protein